MNLNRYELTTSHHYKTFQFISEGPHGHILKVIQFQEMELPDMYNLAFGDKDAQSGRFNDEAVSRNRDTEKVLATVAAAVYAFTEQHPNAWIYAVGSTKARNRLYQMGINKYFDIAQADFEIMGEKDEEWELYQRGTTYDGFAVYRKKN